MVTLTLVTGVVNLTSALVLTPVYRESVTKLPTLSGGEVTQPPLPGNLSLDPIAAVIPLSFSILAKPQDRLNVLVAPVADVCRHFGLQIKEHYQ